MGMYWKVNVIFGWEYNENTKQYFPDINEFLNTHEPGTLVVLYDDETDLTYFGVSIAELNEYDGDVKYSLESMPHTILINEVAKNDLHLSLITENYGMPKIHVFTTYE